MMFLMVTNFVLSFLTRCLGWGSGIELYQLRFFYLFLHAFESLYEIRHIAVKEQVSK